MALALFHGSVTTCNVQLIQHLKMLNNTVITQLKLTIN